MSMLSAQCDELRTLAYELSEIEKYNVDMSDEEDVTLASSAVAMREAADTIEGLRDRLQDDALRGECEPKWTLQGTTQTQEFWRCDCGNCGECFGIEDRQSFPFKMTIDKVKIPNYCPECGWKVVKQNDQMVS